MLVWEMLSQSLKWNAPAWRQAVLLGSTEIFQANVDGGWKGKGSMAGQGETDLRGQNTKNLIGYDWPGKWWSQITL